MSQVDIDQKLRDIQREYLDFLDDDGDQGYYFDSVKDLISSNGTRLIVNINDLRKKNPKRANALLNEAFEELIAFQKALKEFVASADATYCKNVEEFFIGLEGSFGSKHVTPRNLTSRFLGNTVCLEGIVTKCSLVRPKVVRSVHYCPTTTKTLERRYTDMTSLDAFPSSAVYPTKDEEGNLLETEYGLSIFKDHQTFTIQEMPEKAPAGQLPRSVDIIVDNDLVDQAKPGDRVQIIGTYRCLPGKKGGFTSGAFRTILIANNVKLMSKEMAPKIFADDVRKCKNFVKHKGRDVFELLAKSLAPSIHGHEYIKKALLCMLLGGVEKILPNGTRLRGDINILLIGDPSVAKSQLLRYVLQTAPRAIPTTGRGSSGVGLTAAVTTDQETGERRLEAGAMVLADRGVVCIDEFDKMSDIDRTAIHEVMEQGRVSIAKAGIHAKLNARCSVLAAANPVYGRYDQYKTPMENIGLQDSLLSRFDLLFIMLDKSDPENDREISDHVVRMHRYRSPGEQDGDPLPIASAAEFLATKDLNAEEEETETPIFEKFDSTLHGTRAKKDKIVSVQFMKKYIHIAKVIKPSLTQDACNVIAEEYSRLRSMEMEQSELSRTQPVTARALETLIRLATAHAKARLSRTVDVADAQAAIELVQYAYFKKVIEKPSKRKRQAEQSTDEESEEEDMEDVENKNKKKSTKKSEAKRPRKKPGDEGYDPYDIENDEDEEIASSLNKAKKAQQVKDLPPSTEITDERLKRFRSLLFQVFKAEHAQSLGLEKVTGFLKVQENVNPFTSEEVQLALDKMSDANQIMLADNIIFLI